MNENSVESYRKLVDDGTLSMRQAQVLLDFDTRGPMTARQATEHMPGAWKRCSELCAMGALETVESVQDALTHRKVALYRIPDPFPTSLRPLPKHKMSKAQAEAFLEGARRFKELMDNQMSVADALRAIQQEAQ